MKVLVPTLSMLIGTLALGCAYDTTDAPETEGEVLGVTSQALSGWWFGALGQTQQGPSLDTGMPVDTSTCFLSGVAGHLGQGGLWQPLDVRSSTGIGGVSGGTWGLWAHGGAHQDQTNTRDWFGNPVLGHVTCVGYPRYVPPAPLAGSWSGGAPKKIADFPISFPHAPTNRRCYLSEITGGDGLFHHSTDYVRVVKVTVTDSQHPTTGWYIEGSVQNNPDFGGTARARATCVNYPALTEEWTDIVGPGTYTLTQGTAIKGCGLTRIQGAFNVNDFNNGVRINAPATINGQWTVTVSPGKGATTHCAQ
jgi:hypothetical protein